MLSLFTGALMWTVASAGQEWPPFVNEWDDESFQARVLGVYDWIGSGPDRLQTLEYSEDAINLYQISTVNRDIEYFPPRVNVNPDRKFHPPPKDWVDRERLIAYMADNSVIEEGYFEENLEEDAGPDTHYLMGNIYFQQGKFEQAIESYKQAIQEFPRFQLAYKNMSYAYFKMGNCDEALAASRQATEFHAFTARLKGIEGYCSLQQGKYYSANESFAIARVLDQKNGLWADLELESLVKLGRYRQAEKILGRKLMDPGASNIYFDYLIEIYRGENKQQELMAALEIKRRLGAITDSELLELNGIKISAGVSHLIDDNEISAYIGQTTLSQQELSEIVNNKVNVSGWDAASELMEEVVQGYSQIFPVNLSVLQAKTLSESDNYEEALALLERVLIAEPLHCNALMVIAEIYSELETTDMAQTYLRRAENSSQQCRNEALRMNAKLMLEQGEYASSLESYRRLTRQQAIDGDVKDLRQAAMINALNDLVQLKSL